MRKTASMAAAFFLAALLYPVFSARAEIEIPPARGFVNDYAGVIDAGDERAITAIIKALQSNTRAEIAVLTVESTGDEPISDYAMAVAEKWKPGDRELDNGLVFVLAVADRRTEVLTGYGLEGVLPDGKVGGMLDRYALPHFRQGNYGPGVLAAVRAFAAEIDPANAGLYQGASGGAAGGPAATGQPPEMTFWRGVVMALGLIFMIYLAIRHPWLFFFLLMSGGRGGGGGGGGFGGGFGGFGGGGFGGGGAGRGW